LAEIGRLPGVTSQAIYLALRSSDREMMKAFKQAAETHTGAATKLDTQKGLLLGNRRGRTSGGGALQGKPRRFA